jgi:hypothetical protein
MSNSQVKFFGSYTQKEHATPKSKTVLKCGICHSEIVQHLGVQDGWSAGTDANGLVWICDKKICKEEAPNKGVVFRAPGR